jgi:hypothetical protein
VRNKYNKFFVQIGEGGCRNLIYWDKDTNVKAVLKSDNVSESETIMKIKLLQPEILMIFYADMNG